ncbi:MAG: hypothetical protein JKY82_08495 [Rhizobiaceae bacterium]|nr:hypothetical protein [Rhizobiaceae bacterium]
MSAILILLIMPQSLAAQEQSTSGRLLAVPKLPVSLFQYKLPLPDHLQKQLPPSASNIDTTITDAGATLGRVLFYDLKLSKNGLVSCASCHSQNVGFDDPTRFSIGFEGKITRRHAMGLANGLFNRTGRFFWDERAATLEEQVLDPFFDPVEMGLKEGELVKKIYQIEYYSPLFVDAFGDGQITTSNIATALSQFVRSMVSDKSPYDVERQKHGDVREYFSGFSKLQNRGKFLFLNPASKGGSGCAQCHEIDAFVMKNPRNNGLDAKSVSDGGWGEVSGKPTDNGKFRAASLKNISLRGPYMHDGRFETLGEVIDHYSSGVKPHVNLDPLLMNTDGTPIRLELSGEDKLALVGFLATLTDQHFLEAPRFSNPFRH